MSTEERESTYRDRLQAAWNDSEDWCARCKHCDRQLDAVLAVPNPEVEQLRAEVKRLGETVDNDGGLIHRLRVESAAFHSRAEKAEAELAAAKKEKEDLSSFARDWLVFAAMTLPAAPPEDRRRLMDQQKRVKAILDIPGDTP